MCIKCQTNLSKNLPEEGTVCQMFNNIKKSLLIWSSLSLLFDDPKVGQIIRELLAAYL